MNTKIGKWTVLIIMILNGILFIINIYVFGNREAAINMHRDLSPTADTIIVNFKVIICFIVGLFYLISAYGILRNKLNLAIYGILAFIIFDGFYIIELISWSGTHPRVWFDFTIFGGLSFLIGLFSFLNWNRRLTK